MLNIDKLRHNWEKPFLELMEGMERKVHPEYPNNILWYKENDWYFELNEKTVIYGVKLIEYGQFLKPIIPPIILKYK